MAKTTQSSQTEPSMSPPDGGSSISHEGAAVPVNTPPNGGGAAGTASASRPQEMSAEQLASASALASTGTAGLSAGVAAWLPDKRVTALWSINQNRNAWIAIDGVGWRKLSNASDSSIVAMGMLASSARQKQSRFDYREEADGMIHEIYLW